VENTASNQGFLARHEFLIRRLHSLSGLVPVGAYMTIHLLTNASILASPRTFQQLVYQIHSLGPLLPAVEWTFIFLPLIFHAVIGVVIVRGGLPNTGTYSHASNVRYTLQRATGMIAFVFIFWHVFHMHGWFHADWWIENVATPLSGARFSPYDAASTAGRAIQQSFLVPVLYAIGVLSCVFHLANGIWTMGITWGVWVSPAAQQRANWIAIVFGVGLSFVGMGALGGFWSMDEATIEEAQRIEQKMFDTKVGLGEIEADSHKKLHGQESDSKPEAVQAAAAAVQSVPKAEAPASTVPVAALK